MKGIKDKVPSLIFLEDSQMVLDLYQSFLDKLNLKAHIFYFSSFSKMKHILEEINKEVDKERLYFVIDYILPELTGKKVIEWLILYGIRIENIIIVSNFEVDRLKDIFSDYKDVKIYSKNNFIENFNKIILNFIKK